MIITIGNDKSWHNLPNHHKQNRAPVCETKKEFRVDL